MGMMEQKGKLVRFKLNKFRSVEAINFLAQQWPGITQYYICKALFFSDREHFLDWGQQITGDRYFALPHGPVPHRIYDLLKPGAGEEDDWLDYFNKLLSIAPEGNQHHVFSKGVNEAPNLSVTHAEYLQRWVVKLRGMSFSQVADMAHEDAAWKAAWGMSGTSSEMDVRLWLSEDGEELDRVLRAIEETACFAQ